MYMQEMVNDAFNRHARNGKLPPNNYYEAKR